ncbi:MAG: hypothetical protein IT303_20220 [Dehalococcoidia bacterium]|nr:hypothetical protein [Dehalococcoidia bacterium]
MARRAAAAGPAGRSFQYVFDAYPFLHAADAASHAPVWALAACLAGGAAAGLLVIAATARLTAPADGDTAPFALRSSGSRGATWFAEVEPRGPGFEPSAGAWYLRTAAGTALPLTIEPHPAGHLALIAPLRPGDLPTAIEYHAPHPGAVSRIPLPSRTASGEHQAPLSRAQERGRG